MNKAMRTVVLMNDEDFAEYNKDRSKILVGLDLTDEERKALTDVDYPKLYSWGAHPFLLNGFTSRAWPGDKAQMRKEFGATIEPYGYPDFST